MTLTPTTFQLGAWSSSLDLFVPHPASPTGAIINLNDGIVWSLQDSGKGVGDGLDLGNVTPSVYKSSNPRTTGERIVTRKYDQSRTIKATLYWGTGSTYSTWIAALRALVGLLEAINQQNPAALQILVSGASSPLYADVLEAHINVPYHEVLWGQYDQDVVEVTFLCKPYFRGNRQYLQNGVTNPGFEAPSGPPVTVFNDNYANFNAYTYGANAFRVAVMLNAPTRYYRLSDAVSSATVVDSAGSLVPGTVVGGVTLGGTPGAISGDSATYALFNGTTGYVTSSASGLPTGAAVWTIGCWCYVTGSPGATSTLITFGLNSTAHGAPQILMTNTRTVQLSDATTATAASAALSINTWHFLVGTYDGTTLRMYVDGAAGTTAAATVAVPGSSTFCVLGATALASPTQFFPGRLQDCFFVPVTLSATEISNLNQVGLGTYTPSALTTDVLRYSDVVMSESSLLRYYRLDEPSGTVAYDAASNVNAAYNGGPTLGVAGALNTDSDTAVTFAAASSQDVVIPYTGLPVGNAAISLECWFKFAANPAANQFIMDSGIGPRVNHQNFGFYLDSSGRLNLDVGSGTGIIQSGALATATYHHVLATWDGTTARFYIDGAQIGTGNTPGAQNLANNIVAVATTVIGSLFFSGQVDEASTYGAALSAARVTAHYNAGHNAPASNANTMLIAQDGAASFGNAVWSDVNLWQATFRYVTGLIAGFYLHYVDLNNYYVVEISGSQMILQQVYQGAIFTSTNVAIVLVNGATYTVQILQGVPNSVGSLQVALLLNTVTAPQIATGTIAGGFTNLGACRIATTGAALALEAPGNSVALFGPGGWTFTSTGTGVASCAWDRQSNGYTGGITTSFYAARVTAAPAGTLNAALVNANTSSGLAVTQSAFPATTGQIIYANAYLRSTGIANSCTQYLQIIEYDVNGNVLRATSPQTATGAQSSWTQLTGNVTLGVNTQFVALALLAIDATAASANGNIWWDNCQLWNSTTTNTTTMPYCEMRFPQAPATILLSGLLGDVVTPATLSAGIAVPAWAANGSITYAIGRRSSISANSPMALVGPLQPNTGSVAYVRDSGSYSGYYCKYTSLSTFNLYDYASQLETAIATFADIAGVFHVFSRMQSSQSTITGIATQLQSIILNGGSGTVMNGVLGQTVYPLSTANAWQLADSGLLYMPPFPLPALAVATSYFPLVTQHWTDTVGSSNLLANWMAHMPVDTSVVLGTINNLNAPTNNQWLFVITDGTPIVGSSTAVDLETKAMPVYSNAGGGTGTTSNGFLNVNATGDSYLSLDPSQAIGTSIGVNQLVVVLCDQALTVSALACECSYIPLYLYPR